MSSSTRVSVTFADEATRRKHRVVRATKSGTLLAAGPLVDLYSSSLCAGDPTFVYRVGCEESVVNSPTTRSTITAAAAAADTSASSSSSSSSSSTSSTSGSAMSFLGSLFTGRGSGAEATYAEELCVFSGGSVLEERLSGSIRVVTKKKLAHEGVLLAVVGQILVTYSQPEKHHFLVSEVGVAPPGELNVGDNEFRFDLTAPPFLYDSYVGQDVVLRYFVRVVVKRKRASDIVHEQDFWVQSPGLTDAELPEEARAAESPEMNEQRQVDVGIEDHLHIVFQFDKSWYHLEDVILGQIFFALVRIPIQQMYLSLIRKEIIGSGATAVAESTVVATYELMDGYPEFGDNVPVRFFLSPVAGLTPTYLDVHHVFSVRYFVNLVLIDQDDRKFFKQQEIVVWRRRQEEAEAPR